MWNETKQKHLMTNPSDWRIGGSFAYNEKSLQCKPRIAQEMSWTHHHSCLERAMPPPSPQLQTHLTCGQTWVRQLAQSNTHSNWKHRRQKTLKPKIKSLCQAALQDKEAKRQWCRLHCHSHVVDQGCLDDLAGIAGWNKSGTHGVNHTNWVKEK